jgi:hypothetical protein
MKTFQKKSLLLLPLFLFCLSLTSDVFAKPKLHIVITTKYKGQDCQTEGGWCISISTWGDRLISLPGASTDPAGRNAELQVSDDGRTATLVFAESKNPVKFSVFEAEADVVLTSEVARALGCNSVVLLKGTYKVDYSKSRGGCIVFNTRIQ